MEIGVTSERATELAEQILDAIGDQFDGISAYEMHAALLVLIEVSAEAHGIEEHRIEPRYTGVRLVAENGETVE